MRARTLLLLVAVAMSGCAAQQDVIVVTMGSTTQTCKTQSCVVNVTVGPGCSISTDGDNLTVAPGNSNDVTVTWQIAAGSSGTVAFTASGVDPKPGSNGEWHREFRSPTPGTTTFSWIDKNKKKETPYQYNIFITQKQPGQNAQVCKYDPIIINN